LQNFQQIKYKSLGMNLPKSTIGEWTAKSIDLLNYLYQRLQIRVRGSSYLMADETTIKVHDKATKGKTHLGYYWVYRAVEEKIVFFSYHAGRDHTIPLEFLQGFKGKLQTDGLKQYETVNKKLPDITLVGCMAHARRKFDEAQTFAEDKCGWMLDRVQELYAIEDIARQGQYSTEQRLKIRQEKSVPVLSEIKQWLDEQVPKDGTSNPLTTALHYMNDRWGKLNIFTTDGGIEIDNNLVENAIRPVALGRKNWLFAGSHAAAQRGAIIFSLVETCKMNGIDPYKWLYIVLEKLPAANSSEFDGFLPIAENLVHFKG
jgi:transposase